MAKKLNRTENSKTPYPTTPAVTRPVSKNNQAVVNAEDPAPAAPSYLQFRFQAIFLALLSILLYANTFSHEYAFDDMMAIVNNEYVQEGVPGISKILTTDAYQSYLEQHNGANQLTGGRYRPLSLVSFAIEQQILGINDNYKDTDGKPTIRTKEQEDKLISDMHARHFINVLLYALCVVVLLQFMHKIVFPNKPVAAFIAALLFAIHPLHTEVVANVKSRDEILSVLFICLTFLKAFSYKDHGKKSDLYLGMLYFFLALLSKEYAITLTLLLPAAIYIYSEKRRLWQVSSLLSPTSFLFAYICCFG